MVGFKSAWKRSKEPVPSEDVTRARPGGRDGPTEERQKLHHEAEEQRRPPVDTKSQLPLESPGEGFQVMTHVLWPKGGSSREEVERRQS